MTNENTLDLPPHSPEAENGVLGCLLLKPELVHDLADANVTPDWFYQHTARFAVESVRSMVENGHPVDLITIGERLRTDGNLEGIGGLPYLSAAMDSVPSAANLQYYLGILREKTTARRIAATCAAVVSETRQGIQPDIARIEASIADAKSVGTTATAGIADSKTVCHEFIDWLQMRSETKGKLSGVPTGIRLLDHFTDGIQYAEFTVIAARPSIGKTAFGCCLSSRAVSEGIPSLFVTAEMSKRMIMRRILSNRASVPMNTLRGGDLSDTESRRLAVAMNHIKTEPLFFEEMMGGATIGRLISSIRAAHRIHSVKIVVIDYIQKFRGDSEREKKTEELADVTNKLQAISRELGIAIVGLAQLNRENEKEKKPRKPKLTDLRESGAIEQDADTVIAIHRSDRSDPDAELCVIKQRDGECGDAKCNYEGQYCRFEEREQGSPIDHSAL